MTTVIFVHGTGGRQKAYAETFQEIEKQLKECHSDAKLMACLWGDSFGARLNAEGASIPEYREAEGGHQSASQEELTVRSFFLVFNRLVKRHIQRSERALLDNFAEF